MYLQIYFEYGRCQVCSHGAPLLVELRSPPSYRMRRSSVTVYTLPATFDGTAQIFPLLVSLYSLAQQLFKHARCHSSVSLAPGITVCYLYETLSLAYDCTANLLKASSNTAWGWQHFYTSAHSAIVLCHKLVLGIL